MLQQQIILYSHYFQQQRFIYILLMENVLYVHVTLQSSCFLCDDLLLALHINTSSTVLSTVEERVRKLSASN